MPEKTSKNFTLLGYLLCLLVAAVLLYFAARPPGLSPEKKELKPALDQAGEVETQFLIEMPKEDYFQPEPFQRPVLLSEQYPHLYNRDEPQKTEVHKSPGVGDGPPGPLLNQKTVLSEGEKPCCKVIRQPKNQTPTTPVQNQPHVPFPVTEGKDAS